MSGHPIEHGDMEALAQILENEKLSHCRMRSLCFGLFVFCFFVMALAVAALVYVLVTTPAGDDVAGRSMTFVQMLAPLCALVVGLFTSWWTAQNCINSIDRTLFAARSGRHRLFASFLQQLQCADKKKRRMMLEVVSSLVT